jgi:hypothetical protein
MLKIEREIKPNNLKARLSDNPSVTLSETKGLVGRDSSLALRMTIVGQPQSKKGGESSEYVKVSLKKLTGAKSRKKHRKE